MAELCALIWNSNWWTGAARASQGEMDSCRIKSPRPRRSHTSSPAPMHVCMWQSFPFACYRESEVGFLQKLVATFLFPAKRFWQILKPKLHFQHLQLKIDFALIVSFWCIFPDCWSQNDLTPADQTGKCFRDNRQLECEHTHTHTDGKTSDIRSESIYG